MDNPMYLLFLILALILFIVLSMSYLIILLTSIFLKVDAKKLIDNIKWIILGLFSGIISAYIVSNKDLIKLNQIVTLPFWTNFALLLVFSLFFLVISAGFITIYEKIIENFSERLKRK